MLAGGWEEKFIPRDTLGHVSPPLPSASVLLLFKMVKKVKGGAYGFQPQRRCGEYRKDLPMRKDQCQEVQLMG